MKTVKRVSAMLLTLCLLLTGLYLPTKAAGTKVSLQRTIAIVFDNSGSMFYKDGGANNQAWSQATYAVEVFATMLRSGDTLLLYPMNPTDVEGHSYDRDHPLTITGGSPAGKITALETMVTHTAGDTPIETLDAAYNGLLAASGQEKWLLVLTDGDRFDEELEGTRQIYDETQTQALLTEKLTGYSSSVNVMYLGIGANLKLPGLSTGMYQAAASDQVPRLLSEMANRIFGRDVLPSANLVNNQFTVDVDLASAIVFVQGSGISQITLKDEAGNVVPSTGEVYSPKASILGNDYYATKYGGNATDSSLSGTLITFQDLPAGTYTLSYSGTASKTDIYYEPDVDLQVWLSMDEAGIQPVTTPLYPGDGYLQFSLVDGEGKPVESDLLGTVTYGLDCSINGKQVADDATSATKISLEEGDELELTVRASYLSGYEITKTTEDFDWAANLEVQPFPAGSITVAIAPGASSYSLAEIEGVTFPVEVRYEGVPLNEEQMQNLSLTVHSLNGGNLKLELVQQGTQCEVVAGHVGSAADTIPGEYAFNVSGSFVNEYGVTSDSTSGTVSFMLTDPVHQLELVLDGGPGRVQASKLGDSSPYILNLTVDGQPLSREQLEQALDNITVTTGGLDYTLTPDVKNSALLLQYEGTAGGTKPEAGAVSLMVQTTLADELGRDLTAQTTDTFSLLPYPPWLPWVIALLILAVLILAFLLFMNQKVLPKSIGLVPGEALFYAGRMQLTEAGDFGCRYPKSGSTRTLRISAPDNQETSCDIILSLAAVDRRWTPSAKRSVHVTRASVSPEKGALLTLNGTDYQEEEGVLVCETPDTSVLLRNGSSCDAIVSYTNLRGSKRKATMSFQLVFR